MPQKQPPMDQIIPELVHSFGEALGLLAAAIATQGDAEKLLATLREQISVAKATQMVSPISIRIATHALAGIEAECLAQRMDKDPQAKH